MGMKPRKNKQQVTLAYYANDHGCVFFPKGTIRLETHDSDVYVDSKPPKKFDPLFAFWRSAETEDDLSEEDYNEINDLGFDFYAWARDHRVEPIIDLGSASAVALGIPDYTEGTVTIEATCKEPRYRVEGAKVVDLSGKETVCKSPEEASRLLDLVERGLATLS